MRRLAFALALLALAACAARAVRGPLAGEHVQGRLVRFGPERATAPYEDARLADKLALIDQINRDRAAAGAPPVRYETRAARMGDAFCRDMVESRYFGHWDLAGRPPYVRWGLAGGLDYHRENLASYARERGLLAGSLRELLLDSHARMMAERPPDDGHRLTILDPDLTHVGIGLGVEGGQFRMSEEFTRVAFDWIAVPAGPVRAGDGVDFAGEPLPGWEVGVVEIRHAPPPRPLSVIDVARLGSYGYPRVVRVLRPRLAVGATYVTGDSGDLDVGVRGRVSLRFAADAGPGYYFVLCYMRPAGREDAAMGPATAAMVTVVP